LKEIVGYQLAQASVLTNRVFEDQVCAEFDLRKVEFTVLVLIDRNPDLAASRLSRALALTPPNVKQWIDRLERRGLVERSAHATDRRVLRLRTTPAGAAVAQAAALRVAEGERSRLSALTPGEYAILLELLHKAAQCRTRK
jgi:DNA-binding MarR family transcriptional regulator